MKRIAVGLVFPLFIIVMVGAQAQTPAPVAPPKYLLIVREDIKPGKGTEHTKNSQAFVRILAKANSPYYRLAATPLTGNENEVTYFWPFDSYASLEKYYQDLDKWASGPYKADFEKLDKQGADLHAAQRDVLATYREDLSYRPNLNSGKSHYFLFVTVRVRPGHGMDFAEARKIVLAAHQKANLDEYFFVYEVSSGTPGPTYYIFVPQKSLKDLDLDIH